jgi:hypothetical protein
MLNGSQSETPSSPAISRCCHPFSGSACVRALRDCDSRAHGYQRWRPANGTGGRRARSTCRASNLRTVQELLANGSKVIVLSRGMQLMLQTCPETLRLLKDRGIDVRVEETRKAAELYNDLAEREPVGGLFHSTC